jgi:hypothetical protein
MTTCGIVSPGPGTLILRSKRIAIIFYIFLFFSTGQLLVGCVKTKVVKEYHSNGKLKSTTEMSGEKRNGASKLYNEEGVLIEEVHWKNGVEHGEMLAYFPDGKLKERHHMVMGKEIGTSTLYYHDGKIAEERFTDSLGRLVDIRSFTRSGERDYDKIRPVVYYDKDTVEVGGQLNFFAKLVNVDSLLYQNGTLIITSKLTPEREPVDTLFRAESDYSSGFHYTFTPQKSGLGLIYGLLVFPIPTDSGKVNSVFSFSSRYYVRPGRTRSPE